MYRFKIKEEINAKYLWKNILFFMFHIHNEGINEGVYRRCDVFLHTWVLVPTSKVIGKQWWGLIPANAVYNDNLPTGMPMPWAPRSPNPNILSPSVTTIARTSCSGQFFKTS